MTITKIPAEKLAAVMQSRIARFADMTPSTQPWIDTRIPEFEREAFNVIGHGVTEDAGAAPAIAEAEGFNVTYVRAESGKGASAHDHPTTEVFIPITGTWTIFCGDDGEHETTLGPADIISVPPGVMRGFKNVGDQAGLLLVILQGDDSGHVDWDPKIFARARATGLDLNDKGELIEIDPA